MAFASMSVQSLTDTESQSSGRSKSKSPKPPKPHGCSLCQRHFARLEHLNRHIRSHTKEKPFFCEICTRAFARMDLLKRHRETVHGIKKNKSGNTTTPSSSAATAPNGPSLNSSSLSKSNQQRATGSERSRPLKASSPVTPLNLEDASLLKRDSYSTINTTSPSPQFPSSASTTYSRYRNDSWPSQSVLTSGDGSPDDGYSPSSMASLEGSALELDTTNAHPYPVIANMQAGQLYADAMPHFNASQLQMQTNFADYQFPTLSPVIAHQNAYSSMVHSGSASDPMIMSPTIPQNGFGYGNSMTVQSPIESPFTPTTLLPLSPTTSHHHHTHHHLSHHHQSQGVDEMFIDPNSVMTGIHDESNQIWLDQNITRSLEANPGMLASYDPYSNSFTT